EHGIRPDVEVQDVIDRAREERAGVDAPVAERAVRLDVRVRDLGDQHQQPIFLARSPKSVATTSQSASGARSLVWPGPCSVGRGTNAVLSPHARAALRSPLCAAVSMSSSGRMPRYSAVPR